MKRATNESVYTRSLMADLQKLGCVTVTLSASVRQTLGVPDRWICGPSAWGFACWLEMKSPKGTLSTDQKILIERIRARSPSSAYVVREPLGMAMGTIEDEARNVLAEFDGTARDLMEKLKWLKSQNR